MSKLDGFKDKDFLEKIAILDEIERTGDTAEIDSLFEFLQNPLKDKAVDTMLRNTLRVLLFSNHDKIISFLTSDNPAVREMCVNIAGEAKLAAAVPVLLDLAPQTKDSDSLLLLLTAMSRIMAPECITIFHQAADNPDPIVQSLCFETLGAYKDTTAIPIIRNQLEGNASEARYAICEVPTWKAIEALETIRTPEAIEVLVAMLHHRNPTARRLIHQALENIGADAVEPVAAVFSTGNQDMKIMAANVLGRIAERRGSDLLIEALDEKLLQTSNELFAAYEALGNIPSMKSIVFLLDALQQEQDDIALMAAVNALDGQLLPGVMQKISTFFSEGLKKGDAQPKRVLQAIVTGRCTGFLEALYDNMDMVAELVGLVAASNNPETIASFLGVLKSKGGEPARNFQKQLENGTTVQRSGRMLAVDDSKAMLNFYLTAASGLGLEVATASNGQDALDQLENSPPFDLIVVDMNMPVMDGIEFTEKTRAMSAYKDVPIIMATTESAKSQAQLAKKAGVTSFLKKPFTIESLQHKIHQIAL